MPYCPPRRAALLAALTLFSSSVFAQSYTEDPVNQKLEQLAVSLAASLKDPSVRQLVKNEVGKKFDGDYNALYSSMANQPLTGERTFRQELVRGISAFSGDTRTAAKSLDHLALEFPRLQIAVPANYEKWDAKKTAPLVAYIPQGVDVDSLAALRAFDGNGKLHLLSTAEAPDFPVVVLGMNERTNELGFLEKSLSNSKSAGASRTFEKDNTRLIEPPDDGGGGGTGGGGNGGGGSCAATTHNDGDREWLRYIMIYNDHEGWFQGYPDIFLTVAYLTFPENCHAPCPFAQLAEPTFDLNEVNDAGQPYYRADLLLNWGSLLSRNLYVHVREADGGAWEEVNVNIDGQDRVLINSKKEDDVILGSTYVNFDDPNCTVYYTNEAQFKLEYAP